MQAPAKLIEQWNTLRSKGDFIKISELYEAATGTSITKEAVGQSFQRNAFNDELFEVVGNYYQAKLDLIAQYL